MQTDKITNENEFKNKILDLLNKALDSLKVKEAENDD